MRVKEYLMVIGLIAAVSFLVSVLTIKFYFTYIRPPAKYYSFDLATVVKNEETYLMNHKKYSVPKSLSKYFNEVNNYLSKYYGKGIVFDKGAIVGSTPYVRDITEGFLKKYPPLGVKSEKSK